MERASRAEGGVRNGGVAGDEGGLGGEGADAAIEEDGADDGAGEGEEAELPGGGIDLGGAGVEEKAPAGLCQPRWCWLPGGLVRRSIW